MVYNFLKKQQEKGSFELEIDLDIFAKDIVLKTAFQYLDMGYFFFKKGPDNTMLVQCKTKEKEQDIEKLLCEFSDTLLEVQLRDMLEKENKFIREALISKALYGAIEGDENQVPEHQTENTTGSLDFEKDIDEILKDIENDPDLQIDEAEIQNMLDDLKEENKNFSKDNVTMNIDMEGLKEAKNTIGKKKK